MMNIDIPYHYFYFQARTLLDDENWNYTVSALLNHTHLHNLISLCAVWGEGRMDKNERAPSASKSCLFITFVVCKVC